MHDSVCPQGLPVYCRHRLGGKERLVVLKSILGLQRGHHSITVENEDGGGCQLRECGGGRAQSRLPGEGSAWMGRISRSAELACLGRGVGEGVGGRAQASFEECCGRLLRVPVLALGPESCLLGEPSS